MVLVSPPKRVIQGVICEPGAWWNVSGGSKEAGRYPMVRPAGRCCLGVLSMPPMRCIGWHQREQGEDK
jgi:hypothetical protein